MQLLLPKERFMLVQWSQTKTYKNISCQRLHYCGTELLLPHDIPPTTAALLVKTNRMFQRCLHATSRSYFGSLQSNKRKWFIRLQHLSPWKNALFSSSWFSYAVFIAYSIVLDTKVHWRGYQWVQNTNPKGWKHNPILTKLTLNTILEFGRKLDKTVSAQRPKTKNSFQTLWWINITIYILSYAEEIMGDHQCGFRRNRPTTDHIFCIRQILEKKWEHNEAVHQLFVDFKKACD